MKVEVTPRIYSDHAAVMMVMEINREKMDRLWKFSNLWLEDKGLCEKNMQNVHEQRCGNVFSLYFEY